MIKMAKAMGVENASSGKDFIAALDKLIEDVGCADLKMSDEGITKEELKQYPAKVHEVLGGDINADPKALKWLDDKQIEYTLVDIKEDHPDEKTLRKLHKKSGFKEEDCRKAISAG